MAQALWNPVAEEDLGEILYYIAFVDRSPSTGERIYYEIRNRVNEQVQRSLPGHSHPEAPEGWLYFRFKRWPIFYQPHLEGIEIMRVIDGVRDLPQHLRDI